MRYQAEDTHLHSLRRCKFRYKEHLKLNLPTTEKAQDVEFILMITSSVLAFESERMCLASVKIVEANSDLIRMTIIVLSPE